MQGKRSFQHIDTEETHHIEEESDEENEIELIDSEIIEGEEAFESDEDETPLEPFNMRTEMSEGHFDRETGAYVWKNKTEKDSMLNKNSSEESDLDEDETWMHISPIEMQKAESAALKRTQIERKNNQNNHIFYINELVALLFPQETPMEAIARRGSTEGPRWGKKFNSNVKSSNETRIKNRKEIELITEICSNLPLPESQVYEMCREEFIRYFNL